MKVTIPPASDIPTPHGLDSGVYANKFSSFHIVTACCKHKCTQRKVNQK